MDVQLFVIGYVTLLVGLGLVVASGGLTALSARVRHFLFVTGGCLTLIVLFYAGVSVYLVHYPLWDPVVH